MRSFSMLHPRFVARGFARDNKWLRVAWTMVREAELLEAAQLRTRQLAAEIRRCERALRRRLARRASVVLRRVPGAARSPAGSDSRAPSAAGRRRAAADGAASAA